MTATVLRTVDEPFFMSKIRIRVLTVAIYATVGLNLPLLVFAQSGWLRNGNTYITPSDLPADFAASLQQMGGRMMSANNAMVTLVGTITDANGSRAAQVTVQAPGYLRYQENGTSSAEVLTFAGSQFQSQNSKGSQTDERIQESLLAHLPDSIFLQLDTGGGLRRIGSHFRTDNGTTPNYAGPYWTLYSFAPAARKSLVQGQALQQQIFIAIDEQTWLISEIRMVNQSIASQIVTQTQFSSWFQQSGQWYPGQIVRLENGNQVLTFQITQASVGAAAPTATFEP